MTSARTGRIWGVRFMIVVSPVESVGLRNGLVI